MASRSGSCSCGAVRYRLTAEPMFVHCCHCLLCQKQTGSAFVINALIETSRVKMLRGRPHGTVMPTESGRSHSIYRCGRCKVALWSYYGPRRRMLFLRVSTLDQPHALTPDVHIFTRSKVPWVGLPKGARAFPIYYEREKEWPAESLRRLEKLLSLGG